MKMSIRDNYHFRVKAENELSTRDNSADDIKTLLEQYVKSPEWERNYDNSNIMDGIVAASAGAHSAASDVSQEITKIKMKNKFGVSGEDEYLNTISQEDWDTESDRHDAERRKNNWDDKHKYDEESERLREESDKIAESLYPIVEAFFKDQLKRDAITIIDKTYGMTSSQVQDFKDGL